MKTRLLLAACLFGAGVSLAPAQVVAKERCTMTAATDSVYEFVDELASFPGGETAQMEFIAKNLHYPEAMRQQGKSGRVFVTFEISRKGQIMNPRIVKTPDEGFNEEVLRVIKKMPKWKPAKYHGKKVAMRMTLPIMFRMP